MTENEESLTALLEAMSELTSDIQGDISYHLIKHKQVFDQVDKDNNGPENIMMEKMNRATLGFVSQMPLATLNSVNLFMNLLAYHSEITGDQTLVNILRKIRLNNSKEETNEST